MTVRVYIHQPSIVFQALVNQAVVAYPTASVTYDTVSEGAFGDIEPEMTVLFGTSAGADDLGRQRIRKAADATTIYFGRSSPGKLDGEVIIKDNAHITVLNDYRPWMKAPFIKDDGTILKDHDIAYSDQNEDSPPVANAGPDRFGTVDSGTSKLRLTIPPTANTSFATADGASISSYLWTLPAGVTLVTGTLTSSQITVDVDAGQRYIKLVVTDSNGKTATARVFTVARGGSQSEITKKARITSHQRTQEGQLIELELLESLPAGSYNNGTRVIVWEGEPVGGDDLSHHVFSGWHMSDPARVGAERTGFLTDTTLRCGDMGAMMRRMPEFPVEIISTAAPANWGQMVAPNMDKFLHFLLAHHTNVLELADWSWTGTGSNYPFVILGADGESAWDQVQRKAKSLVPDYVLTCNRLGQLQTLPDPMIQQTADRTATVQKALAESNIADISWEGQAFPRVHWLRGEAILADADTISAIFCIAPGPTPGQGLNEQTSGEQLAKSQADLNWNEAHRYARLNAPYSLFSIILAGSDDYDIDPADMTWITASLGATYAAARGLTLASDRFLPREINTTRETSPTGTVKTHDILAELETEGTSQAFTEVIEVDDPPPDPDPGPWPDPDPDPGPLPQGANNIVGVNTDGYIYKTSTFMTPGGAGGPSWSRVSMGLTGTPESFFVDPFSPLYIGTGSTVNGWVATTTNIYYIEDLFNASPTVTNQHTFANATGANQDEHRQIVASFGNYFSNQAWVVCVSHYAATAGHTGTWATFTTDHGGTWSSEVQITAHYDSGTDNLMWPALYVSPRHAGLAYTAAFTSTTGGSGPDAAYYRTDDYGASWSLLGTGVLNINPEKFFGAVHVPWPENTDSGVAYNGNGQADATLRLYRANGSSRTHISPTDSSGRTYGSPFDTAYGIRTYDRDRRYVAVAGYSFDGTGRHAAFVSDDYGDSWTRVSPVVTFGNAAPRGIAYAGDTYEALYLWGFAGYVAYSANFGATVDDRTGDMGDLGPPGTFLGIAGGAS